MTPATSTGVRSGRDGYSSRWGCRRRRPSSRPLARGDRAGGVEALSVCRRYVPPEPDSANLGSATAMGRRLARRRRRRSKSRQPHRPPTVWRGTDPAPCRALARPGREVRWAGRGRQVVIAHTSIGRSARSRGRRFHRVSRLGPHRGREQLAGFGLDTLSRAALVPRRPGEAGILGAAIWRGDHLSLNVPPQRRPPAGGGTGAASGLVRAT